MSIERDFIGYGMTPPAVAWPGGARIAVQVAVNYEEGSESELAQWAKVGRQAGVKIE